MPTNTTMTKRGIAVGIDGSEGSTTALKWAEAHTDIFGPIHPVISWHFPVWATAPPLPGSPAPLPRDYFEDLARETVDRSMRHVSAQHQRPAVVSQGRAGKVLCSIGARCDLVVVGSRGRSAAADAFGGSTSTYCAAHSPSPVAIVPHGADTSGRAHRIVVGVDGSTNANAALLWAIDHAPTGAVIVALYAHLPLGAPFELAETYSQLSEERALSLLDDARAHAISNSGRPSTEYELVTRHVMGDPREALEATEAELIVVGARGHRGIAHLVLGSVATSLTHRTKITTVVVPDPGV